MDKENKKSGLTEIIVGLLIFVGFPFMGNFLSIVTNLDFFPFYGRIMYFAYVLGFVLLSVGLVKMSRNKPSKILTAGQNEKRNKRGLIWMVTAFVLIVIGAFIFFIGMNECEKPGSSVLCVLGYFIYMVPFISVGLFILLIKAVKHFTKNK